MPAVYMVQPSRQQPSRLEASLHGERSWFFFRTTYRDLRYASMESTIRSAA